jgi:hypothetical protein
MWETSRKFIQECAILDTSSLIKLIHLTVLKPHAVTSLICIQTVLTSNLFWDNDYPE